MILIIRIGSFNWMQNNQLIWSFDLLRFWFIFLSISRILSICHKFKLLSFHSQMKAVVMFSPFEDKVGLLNHFEFSLFFNAPCWLVWICFRSEKLRLTVSGPGCSRLWVKPLHSIGCSDSGLRQQWFSWTLLGTPEHWLPTWKKVIDQRDANPCKGGNPLAHKSGGRGFEFQCGLRIFFLICASIKAYQYSCLVQDKPTFSSTWPPKKQLVTCQWKGPRFGPIASEPD